MRLKYLKTWIDKRTGRTYARFRRKGILEVQLPGVIGSAEFHEAYLAALKGAPAAPSAGAARTAPGSLNALVAEFLTSTTFTRLSRGTQAKRRSVLEQFRRACGDLRVAGINRAFIQRTLDERKGHMSKEWLKALRPLMQFAATHGYCEVDPTENVRAKAPPKSDGFYTPTDEDIAKFQAHHPIGSRARLAFDLALYTGQRRGDLIRMGPHHIHDEDGGRFLIIKQEKTGMRVRIPLLPELIASLAAIPTSAGVASIAPFLRKLDGKPFKAGYFTEQFSAWCDEAGLPAAFSPHSLRKAMCCRMIAKGATVHEAMAVLGHKTLAEVQRYGEKFARDKSAEAAMAKMQKLA